MSQEGAIPPSKGGDATDLKKWIIEYAEQVKQVLLDNLLHISRVSNLTYFLYIIRKAKPFFQKISSV